MSVSSVGSHDTNELCHGKSSLISRNITVFGRRTSIRLEPEMWQALTEISDREECTVHDLCTLVGIRKKVETSLTAAIRVFIMLYFRAAATEQGHLKASHGNFKVMKERARVTDDHDHFFTTPRPKDSHERDDNSRPRHRAA